MQVFQPSLVKIFIRSSVCPIRGPDGAKPVVYRVERWLVKINILPIETRTMYRVITAPDAKTGSSGACNHPSGCSVVNANNGNAVRDEPGPSRRRPLGVDADMMSVGNVSPAFSFADDMMLVRNDANDTGAMDNGADAAH